MTRCSGGRCVLSGRHLVVGQVALVARHDVGLAGHRAGLGRLLSLHRTLLLQGQRRHEGGLGDVAGQRVGGQRGQQRGEGQGAGLGDQLAVQNVCERTLHTVVDGAPTGGGTR